MLARNQGAAAGGTQLADTAAARAAQPVLSDAQAEALGEIARDAARALDYAGAGHDLEWAWDGRQFWILQARPITATARYTYPALRSQPSYWSRGNTREVLPEAMSALEWDSGRVMAQRMLSSGFELSGYAPLPGVRLAALFQGRVYLDASVIQWVGYDALGVPPAAMNALLGGPQPAIEAPAPTPAQRLRHAARILRYLRRAAPLRKRAETDLPRLLARARAWLDEPLPAAGAELGARLRTQFLTVLGADELFFLQGSGGGALSKLLELVEKACPGQGHALTAALMAGGEPSVTASQGYALMALAELAQADAAALAWLRSPQRDSAAWREALPDGSPFKQAFADFLGRYGHRAVYETYLRNPRWREAPGYLLDSVVNLIGADAGALRARQAASEHERERALRDAGVPMAVVLAVPFALAGALGAEARIQRARVAEALGRLVLPHVVGAAKARALRLERLGNRIDTRARAALRLDERRDQRLRHAAALARRDKSRERQRRQLGAHPRRERLRQRAQVVVGEEQDKVTRLHRASEQRTEALRPLVVKQLRVPLQERVQRREMREHAR